MRADRNPERNPVNHRRSGYRWVCVGPVWPDQGRIDLSKPDPVSRRRRPTAPADHLSEGIVSGFLASPRSGLEKYPVTLKVMIGQPVALLQNRSAEGHWLMLDFGVPSPGIRARVEFEDGTEINRIVTTGGSWLSSEDPRLHFGLGSHDRVALLEVARTDGTTVRLENVKADQVVQINEMVPWPG